jgi:23S rRNA (guanosine2251-2'-O)-methyltransferase
VPNLAAAMGTLRDMGYALVGMDGAAEGSVAEAAGAFARRPLGLVLGAEGPGMRELTGKLCDRLARIPAAGAFGSLNVSNAAAVALYAAAETRRERESG